jgi:glutathione synthase
MRFVYVMDPMDRILPDKDTTFALQRAAQGRGHTALHCLPKDLFLQGGDVHATVREVTVSDQAPYFTFGPSAAVRLADVEAVFIRKDPPFDVPYLYATLLLERARGRTVLVNDPRGLRDANEKLYGQHFARHMPRTLVAANRALILDFVRDVGGKGVIKPLYGAGGAGVMLLRLDDKNTPAILETLTQEGTQLAMVQEFLPAVTAGDKRVLLMDGEVLGAINRVAHGADFRSNIHVGGRVEPCEVTPAERAIIADIAPRLRSDGLIFVGLDLIGEKITEVNVTSPTGIQELSRHVGEDVAVKVIRWVEVRANDLRPSLKSIPAL